MPLRRRRSLCLASLAVAFLLTEVLLAPLPAAPASPRDPLDALQVQSFPDPLPAPALSFRGVDGGSLRVEDLKGKVVFLNFWATWCVPCREEMPAMERLYKGFRARGLAVVAVNYGETKAQIQGFSRELSLSFPLVMDPDGAAARALGVRGLPVTYLLGRDGRIQWRAIGSREWDSLAGRAYFGKILQGPQP